MTGGDRAGRLVSGGIIPPVPTPLTARGEPDGDAFGRIFEHLREGGVDGVFVLGSTGELASLTVAQRRRAIRRCVDALGGRLPLLVGVTDPSTEETVALAGFAAEAGAAAVVVTAPFYYQLGRSELRRHLAGLLPRLPLPVLVYNMPWLAGHRFDADCIRAALDQPNLVGFKDSSGEMAYLRRLLRICRERNRPVPVLVGSDFMVLKALAAGAAGAVAGGANLYPHLFRGLLDSWRAGDCEAARACQLEISRLGRRIFNRTRQPCSVFATVKGGLAGLGLCRPDMLPPLTTSGPRLVAELRELLAAANLAPRHA